MGLDVLTLLAERATHLAVAVFLGVVVILAGIVAGLQWCSRRTEK